MGGFHETRFPEKINYMFQGGPGFKTTVIQAASGSEQRIAQWGNGLRTWKAASGPKDAADMTAVLSFFLARYGRLYGFRWKDWDDYRANMQPLANPNGTTMQLQMTYADAINPIVRSIVKPRPDISETKSYVGISLYELSRYSHNVIYDVPSVANYWEFNERPGVTCVDSVGGLLLAPNGTPLYLQPGPIPGTQAITFDGKSYLSGVGPAPTTKFSIEFWINVPAGGGGGFFYIGGTIGTTAVGFGLNASPTSIYIWSFGALANNIIGTMIPGAWNHVVFTADLTGTPVYAAYINGVPSSWSGTGYGGISSWAGYDTMYWGQDITGYGGGFFTGSLSNLAWYTDALSAGQVATNYSKYNVAPIQYTENTDYTVDYTTGIITLAAPHLVYAYAWSGEFDVPARFTNDNMDYSRDSFTERNWDDLQIMELRNGS